MPKYKSWLKTPSRFISMTGYTIEDFNRLLPYFEEAHDQYLSKHEISGKKKSGFRRFVIYQSSPLPSYGDRLCFILFYFKHNPVQEVQADLFDMEQGQANAYIHGLQTILNLALERAKCMPARTNAEFQTILKTFEDKELIHDGSEREVPRPQDKDLQENQYSGEKKKHTIKNAFVASMFGVILFVSPTYAGRVHDKSIADNYHIPPGFSLWQDTGYQGYSPVDVDIIQPTKKPKGKDLTEDQKNMNRSISSVRVRIEHFIGGVKRYRIVKDECRAYKNDFRDKIIGACTALYNFRIIENKPQYADNQ